MRTRVASHGGSVLPVSDHLPGQPTSLPEVPLVRSWQKYVAEFLGTLILVFVGSVAILSTQVGGDARILGIAFGFGIALLAGLYAFGEVSGGHFNPIVSLGMFLDRRLSALDTIWYWIAQFLGAIAASLLILVLWADRDAVKATATTSASDARGFFLELIFSALFVAVILQVTRSDRYGASALVAIPLTLFAIHVALIPFTGSSVNPARTFGPDLVGATGWSDIWIYLLAPPAGAIIGWAVHMVTVRGDTSLRDDLSRAAGDMRKVEFDDIRQGPGQVPPPPSPDEPQNPQGPGQV
jgi:aquaporin Z